MNSVVKRKTQRPFSASAGGAAGICRTRMPPPRARRFPGSPANIHPLFGSWFRGFGSGSVSVHAVVWFARTIRDRLPSRYPLQNALGILGRRDVAVIVLDHLDGCSHLFCQEINVNAFRQAEGGVGVAETIAASSAAGRTVEQAGLCEKAHDQGAIETRIGFSRTGGEYEIIRLGCLADCFD